MGSKTKVKTWADQEVLTHTDLNAEIDNFYSSPMALISPCDASLDLNAQTLILDGDQDTTIKSDTEDQIDFTVGGTLMFQITDVIDTLGKRLDLDDDNDSSIRETADDIIALELQGMDAVIFDGNVGTPVNGFTLTTSATGTPVSITSQGTDPDIDIDIIGKGAADFTVNLGGYDAFVVDGSTASLVNGIQVTATATGVHSIITDTGEGNGINLVLSNAAGTLQLNGEILAGAIINGGGAWDPGVIADGDEEAKEFTVTNAALGDYVLCSLSVDVQDCVLSGAVTAADTVTLVLANNTGGNINIDSGTAFIRVIAKS